MYIECVKSSIMLLQVRMDSMFVVWTVRGSQCTYMVNWMTCSVMLLLGSALASWPGEQTNYNVPDDRSLAFGKSTQLVTLAACRHSP